MDGKANILITVVLILSGVLVGKMAQLQLFSKKYKEQAQKTTLGKEIQHPSRGLIYDRHGELLVGNKTIFDIEAIYNNIPKDIDTLAFCELLDIDKETFVKNTNKDWSSIQYHKASPFIFLSRVDPVQFSIFQEHLHRFPGFYPVERNIRTYPHRSAAHVLGFLGEVDKGDLEADEAYLRGDYKGQSGIEKVYENELRGYKGVSYLLKDNLGRNLYSFDEGSLDSSAIAGSDMVASLDLLLQSYGEELMQGKTGAIVALEPKTGELLSMISSPTYDPNQLTLNKDRGAVYDSLSRDTINKPLFDRAVMAKYPPGSIFKSVLSLIAMQKGVLDKNRTIYCDGTYEVDRRGRFVQKCHAHATATNVAVALQHSCNSYYYQTFREFIDHYGYTTPGIGLDTLVDYLNQFGLGEQLGVDFPIESAGFLPSKEFYNKAYNTKYSEWRSTYILSLGIGQGELQLTTLQMANLAAIIANKGYYYTPHLVKDLTSDRFSLDASYTTPRKVNIDAEHYDPVIEGMARVVTMGTGRQAAVPGIDVCGKTGTSENPHGKDHSVFFAFAPRENPKIAIAVYVENAGWGGVVAAQIAGLMIEKYIKREISPSKQYLENHIKQTRLIPTPSGLTASAGQ